MQCEETATRTRDLPVTGGKTLPLAPGPPFKQFLENIQLKFVFYIGEICEETAYYANPLHTQMRARAHQMCLFDLSILCTNLANALIPFRYLNVVRSEGLEISQPGLDSKLSEIHHRITVRKKTGTFHR